jgi:hypothetical protein
MLGPQYSLLRGRPSRRYLAQEQEGVGLTAGSMDFGTALVPERNFGGDHFACHIELRNRRPVCIVGFERRSSGVSLALCALYNAESVAAVLAGWRSRY